jgi:hemerythrin-like domain-containing protein
MSQRSPIQELQREHQFLVADIKDLEETMRAARDGLSEWWAANAGSFRARLDMFRQHLDMHFRREEEGLFPDAQQMVSERAAPSGILGQFFAAEAEDDMNAHATLRSRAQEMVAVSDEMEEAGGSDEQSINRLRTLVHLARSLLERHAEKEDRLVFPMIERSLDPLQMERVRSRMGALRSVSDLTDPSGRDRDLRDLSMQ